MTGGVTPEEDAFTLNVGKLESLGLGGSLETGYRFSPCGEALPGSHDVPGAG